ncbi:MAG: hypothetical protein QXR09_03235 [Candidatus Aenigmatarchaeota archaeon]
MIETIHKIMVYGPNNNPPKLISLQDVLRELKFPLPPSLELEDVYTIIMSEGAMGEIIIVAMLRDGKLYYRINGNWHCKDENPYEIFRKTEKGMPWTYK